MLEKKIKSDPKILKKVQNTLKTDRIIGEICVKMIRAYKLKKFELVEQFQKIYKERQLEIVKSFMRTYNVNTVVLFLEDINLK